LGGSICKHRSRCARIHLSFLKPGRGFLARRHNLPDRRQHSDILKIGANSPSNVTTITRGQTKVGCSAVITARGKNCFICSFLSELKWGYLNNLLTLIKIAALLRIRKQRAGVQMNLFFRCLAFLFVRIILFLELGFLYPFTLQKKILCSL